MKNLGIDLGTTNTYVYGCAAFTDGQGLSPTPQPVVARPLSNEFGSISTVVMYEDGKPVLAGNVAEQEFYSNIEAQPRRYLASQFKPEIARGDSLVLRYTTDFLRLLRIAMDREVEADTRILVGMPSLSREDYAVHLARCFTDAGWPRPAFVRESDAALVSCLQSGVLDIEDMGKKCLILDFGGGTCDFTSVSNMDVLQNGGDLLYGGRLLDDLIYQTFAETDPLFAAEVPVSPYGWFVHWVACREQKEEFSNFINRIDVAHPPAEEDSQTVLHVAWFDKNAKRHDSYVHDYTKEKFLANAENFAASPELLTILASYRQRGGLSPIARDLLEGRQIGLVSWLREILLAVDDRARVSRVVLTGGSSRWFFVPEMMKRVFPQASCVASKRSYEDIAYGLALYPVLQASREKVQKLLNEHLGNFTRRAADIVRELVHDKTAGFVRLCSQRITEHDILPVLVAASQKSMTIEELEKGFLDNIHTDETLKEIARRKSLELSTDIQRDLDFSFRHWLKENGVLLTPRFEFPARDIGESFFRDLNVKLLDELNIMKFTVNNLLPLLAGLTVGGAAAHGGEPISATLLGAAAFGATWIGARAVPGFMARRKLPRFFLNDAYRKKIVERNQTYIEKELTKSLQQIQRQLALEAEDRIRGALSGMLGSLGVLNQVQVQ